MKKNLFVFAAIAMLVMGCAKEVQPTDTQIPADEQKTYLKVVETKATVSGLGACAWQEGDILHAWFKPAEGDGVHMDFVYEGTFEDGSAKFATTGSVPAEFTAAKLASAAATIKTDGSGFTLVRDYVYDPDSVPVYVRTEQVERNEDGTLSANLIHNASIMQFTLRDIPAYAAGFVLCTSGNIMIKTTFPYKTGYDADIVLHTVVPNNRTVEKFYLIDGDGDEIEGTVKTFTQRPTSTTNEFIEMGLVDFQKENLRKDYVKVCGIKWAKGNLVYDKGNLYNVAQAGVDDNFQTGWGLHDDQYKFIKYDTGVANYENNNDWFDHFNFGGIGRNAKFWSGSMLPSTAEFSIVGRVWKGYANSSATSMDPAIEGTTLVELTDASRFTAPDSGHNVKIDNEALCGDVAFWASKGKYRLPTKTELQTIAHFTSGTAAIQYGYYKTGNVTIHGVLYTTPTGERPKANQTEIEFNSADLESGLFIPKAGRRGPRTKKDDHYDATVGNSALIININTDACYLSGNFGGAPTSSTNQYYNQRENPRRLQISNTSNPVIGYTGGSELKDKDGNYVDNTMSVRAGFSIRPVLVD